MFLSKSRIIGFCFKALIRRNVFLFWNLLKQIIKLLNLTLKFQICLSDSKRDRTKIKFEMRVFSKSDFMVKRMDES